MVLRSPVCVVIYAFRPCTSAPQVKVLQELFPSLNPLRLVEGAPMLLALSERTVRAKSEAWRHVLEARVEQPWEQVRSCVCACVCVCVCVMCVFHASAFGLSYRALEPPSCLVVRFVL